MSADAVMLKIQRMLAEEELHVQLLPEGLLVPFDSTAVFIRVIDQESRTLVSFAAPVVLDAPDSAELTRWVATEGQNYFFGAARLEPQDNGLANVVLDHTLLGDYLDREELHTTLAALARTANDLDEELQGRFGGRRLHEDD